MPTLLVRLITEEVQLVIYLLLTHMSRIQRIVTLSTTKAECVAVAKANK